MDINLRALVLDSLVEYEKSGRKLDDIQHETLKKNNDLPVSGKGFYTRMTRGCVEQKIRLDHIIGSYSNTPVKKMRPVLRWILRMAVYQLSENRSTPDFAVVDESVKLAGKRGFAPLKGFVNAILRNYLRDPGKVKWPEKTEGAAYLSIVYSMPEYLAEKFLGEYGMETAERICQSFSYEKPLAVHVRQTGNNDADTIRSLKEEGYEVTKAPYPEHAYFLTGKGALEDLAAFRLGLFSVQDISSQLAVTAAGIKKDDKILDVCAAPGGKSTFAADLLDSTGSVLARDVSKTKTGKIEENGERLKLVNLKTQVFDALTYDPESAGKYDVVLVDVPCSGYGVIGRKPDIRYTASKEKEAALAETARKILHNAQSYVRPGGTLIFCTCTISRTENEENAAWFLMNYPFRADPLDPYIPEELRCEESQRGFLQLLPDENRDGFFIARFLHE